MYVWFVSDPLEYKMVHLKGLTANKGSSKIHVKLKKKCVIIIIIFF